MSAEEETKSNVAAEIPAVLTEEQLAQVRAGFSKHFPPVSPKRGTDDAWRSKCCTEDGTVINKGFLSFILTSTLSVIVLIFALVQLSINPSSELSSLWVSLVSSISALHLPSPISQIQVDNKKI